MSNQEKKYKVIYTSWSCDDGFDLGNLAQLSCMINEQTESDLVAILKRYYMGWPFGMESDRQQELFELIDFNEEFWKANLIRTEDRNFIQYELMLDASNGNKEIYHALECILIK